MKLCRLDRCGLPHAVKGLCHGHYKRFLRGTPLLLPWNTERRSACLAPDCPEPETSVGAGLCRPHRIRHELGLRMDAPEFTIPLRRMEQRALPPRPACSLPGCDHDSRSTGMCHLHYHRSRKGLNMDRPLRRRMPCRFPRCPRETYARELCLEHGRMMKLISARHPECPRDFRDALRELERWATEPGPTSCRTLRPATTQNADAATASAAAHG